MIDDPDRHVIWRASQITEIGPRLTGRLRLLWAAAGLGIQIGLPGRPRAGAARSSAANAARCRDRRRRPTLRSLGCTHRIV